LIIHSITVIITEIQLTICIFYGIIAVIIHVLDVVMFTMEKFPYGNLKYVSGDINTAKGFIMKNKLWLFFPVLMLIGIGSIFAQEQTVTLDKGIELSSAELAGRVRSGSMIIVLGFKAPNNDLENYIIDGVLDNLVANDGMRVIDRKNTELIQQEHQIQLSGDVSDDYIQGIGHQLGAEYIVTGSFEQNENLYRLRLEMIAVRTAELIGRSTQNIEMDAILAALFQIKWEPPAPWKHKLLSLGLRFGGDLGFYDNKFISNSIQYWDVNISKTDVSFGIIGSVSAGVNIFDWLGVQAEFMFKPIEIQVRADGELSGYTYSEGVAYPNSWAFDEGIATIKYNSIVIPVLAKFMYKPKNFYFAGLIGPYFEFPVGDAPFTGKFFEINWEALFKPKGISMGMTVGANAGLHLGPGILFLDIRYSFNFKQQEFEPVNGSISNEYFSGAKWQGFDMQYLGVSGGNLSFMLGYEFLLVDKKGKK